jgi:hypothetical protein
MRPSRDFSGSTNRAFGGAESVQDKLDDWKQRRVQLATQGRSKSAARDSGRKIKGKKELATRNIRQSEKDPRGTFEMRCKNFHVCVKAEVAKRSASTKLRESIPRNER